MTKTQSWKRLCRTSTARSKQSVSQSCMYVATTVDVHLHLLRQEGKKNRLASGAGWLNRLMSGCGPGPRFDSRSSCARLRGA